MTPDRLYDCQQLLAWTDGQFVRTLNCDERLFRRWRSGERDIPAHVAEWLEALVQFYDDNPPPQLKGR